MWALCVTYITTSKHVPLKQQSCQSQCTAQQFAPSCSVQHTNHPDVQHLQLLHLLLLIACSTAPLLIVKQVFGQTVALPEVIARLCLCGPHDAEL